MAPQTRRDIEKRLREAGIKPKFKRRPVFFLADHGVTGDDVTTLPDLPGL